MSIDSKQIRAAVLTPFRDRGWEKKGHSVYFVAEEVGVVLNVQKSPYAEQHYINVGFWFRSPEDSLRPKENKCPVGRRLERICPDAHELIVASTDSQHSSPDRLSDLSEYLSTEVEPLLLSLLSKDALREAITSGRLGRGMLTVDAKRTLGL